MRWRQEAFVISGTWVVALALGGINAEAVLAPESSVFTGLSAAISAAFGHISYTHLFTLSALAALISQLTRTGMKSRLLATFIVSIALQMALAQIDLGTTVGAALKHCTNGGIDGATCNAATYALLVSAVAGNLYWLANCLPVAAVTTFVHAWLALGLDVFSARTKQV